ncbi:MAG: (Fe-S)-binding protein [Syntrophaceae bacterium]|nr:(Fe-S)-binding protein [Syntrophaceae bacterium]
MALPIGHILGILVDNVKIRRGVIPLSKRKITAWARGLNLPKGGETVIYTGQLYQLIPSINSMAFWMSKFENSWITGFFGLGRIANKVINLSWFMGFAKPSERKAYNQVLHNIAKLLINARIQFGYLYKDDLYSGVLLYDEGVDDVFAEHARYVYRKFKKRGVKRIITLDPHTTHVLRHVYPTIIEGFDIKVVNYLELLSESEIDFSRKLNIDISIHDSCIYARYEKIIDEPRHLLQKAGARIHEPEFSGSLTHCCGGPLESLFPGKAHEIASRRMGQLAACSRNAVTMCPICMAVLKRSSSSNLVVSDIADYLAGAL